MKLTGVKLVRKLVDKRRIILSAIICVAALSAMFVAEGLELGERTRVGIRAVSMLGLIYIILIDQK